MTGKNKDARPTAATVKRATEPGANNHESPESSLNCTISGGGGQIQISDFLSHGQENGVTIHHLEKMTGLDSRTIRARIEAERRAGELIISNNKDGYYLTDDPAEAQRFARSMKHRAREILRTARAVEEAAGCD